jgi:hypothetical protein
MKTQIITTRTLTTILALLLVAFTATQVAAQRREQNNTRENPVKKEKEINKTPVKERNDQREYRKPDDQNKNRNFNLERREGTNPNDNHDLDRADNHKEPAHKDDNHDNWRDDHNEHFNHHNNHFERHPGPDFRPYADPPHFHERDYLWHRYNHISYRVLPRRAVWVFIDGVNYAFYHGKFYLPGPSGFYRVAPPVYLHNLPDNCLQVLVNGQLMWNLNGILFLETPFGFKIIV